MTYCDVYLGRLDDPIFHWDGGDWNGNVPRRTSPFLPGGHDAYSELIGRIKSGQFDGKQTDWGGWVARVTVAQARAFISEVCGQTIMNVTTQAAEPTGEHISDLTRYLDSLDPSSLVALVATEL